MEGNVRARTKGQVRVLVAESTRLGCESLANVLRYTRRLSVATAVTASEMLKIAASYLPDVVLISARLDSEPDGGLKVAGDLASFIPRPKVVILIDSLEPHAVVGAFRAGAAGVFCRDEPIELLTKCVLSVHRGQIWANTTQIEYVRQALADTKPIKIVNKSGDLILSDREMQVVKCVADGLSNRETASVLNLSEHTVKNYLYRVFDKLGVSSRVEVVLYALSRISVGKASLDEVPADAESAESFSGVPPVLEESAESGYALSQFQLGHLFMDGNPEASDVVAAYKWLLLAERSAGAIQNASREAMDQLALRMNATQINEAERQASEWSAQREYPESESALSFSNDGKIHRRPQTRYRKGVLVKMA